MANALRVVHTVLAVTVVVAAISTLAPGLSACDKRGHDCTTYVQRRELRNLPFRIAAELELFAKHSVYPDLRLVEEPSGVTTVLSGQSFLATATPVEVALATKSDNRLRIVSVIQTKPALYVVGAGLEFKSVSGRSVSVSGGPLHQGYLQAAAAGSGMTAKEFSIVHSAKPIPEQVIKGGAAVLLEPTVAFKSGSRNRFFLPAQLREGMAAVLIGRVDELEKQRTEVSRIIGGLASAVAWLYDNDNRNRALDILQKEYEIDIGSAAVLYQDIYQFRIFTSGLPATDARIVETNNWLQPAGLSIDRRIVDTSYAAAIPR